jgi:opacity protein-like surface antigen
MKNIEIKKTCWLTIVIFMAVAPANLLLAGQENGDSTSGWTTEFTPYIWAAELSGDGTLRGRTGSVEADFSDILDKMEVGLMGRTEAWKGKWGVYADLLYLDLGVIDFSTKNALVATDMDLTMTTVDFGIAHRLVDTSVGNGDDRRMSFDLFAGGRYFNLDGEIDIVIGGPLAGLGLGAEFGRKEEWIEPVVGGRFTRDLNDKVAAAIRFDFGGFGIGDCSNLTWNIVAGLDCEIKENLRFKAGYRVFDIDYENGSGATKFGLDAQFRGPIFGFTWLFK